MSHLHTPPTPTDTTTVHWTPNPNPHPIQPHPDITQPHDLQPTKPAVSHATTDDDGHLHLHHTPISWAQWQTQRNHPDQQWPNHPHPALAAVHLLITTDDDKLLLTQRSTTTAFHPNTWSASIEEGAQTQDQTVADTTIRGLNEELGITGPNTSRLLAIGREHNPETGHPWGIVLICHTHLHHDATTIAEARHQAQDADEHQQITFIDLPDQQLPTSPTRHGWHPTSLLRMLVRWPHLTHQTGR